MVTIFNIDELFDIITKPLHFQGGCFWPDIGICAIEGQRKYDNGRFKTHAG